MKLIHQISFICVFLLGTMPYPAVSQEKIKGVAFVEAPEQNSGMCFGDSPAQAFSCAKKRCASNGTPESECESVKWCYPSGWSADLFLQHKEGPHWHQYLCGWGSRGDIEAASKLVCEGEMKQYLIECDVVQIWDNFGKQVK